MALNLKKMTGFFEALGEFFQFSFIILPKLGNIPNLLFFIIGLSGFIYWMIQLNKFSKTGSRFDRYKVHNDQ